MADRFPLLTDEQIESMVEASFRDYMADKNDDHDIDLARAVEEATRAPLLAEIERLTAELEDAKRGQTGALDLVSRIRWAVGDHGARMQPELIEYLRQMRTDAERYRWLRELPVQPTGEDLDKVIDAAQKEPTNG